MNKIKTCPTLKVGDKVRIRGDLVEEQHYGNLTWLNDCSMCKVLGKTVTIRRAGFGGQGTLFVINETSYDYNVEMIDWDYMAKYPFFEVGDRVEYKYGGYPYDAKTEGDGDDRYLKKGTVTDTENIFKGDDGNGLKVRFDNENYEDDNFFSWRFKKLPKQEEAKMSKEWKRDSSRENFEMSLAEWTNTLDTINKLYQKVRVHECGHCKEVTDVYDVTNCSRCFLNKDFVCQNSPNDDTLFWQIVNTLNTVRSKIEKMLTAIKDSEGAFKVEKVEEKYSVGSQFISCDRKLLLVRINGKLFLTDIGEGCGVGRVWGSENGIEELSLTLKEINDYTSNKYDWQPITKGK